MKKSERCETTHQGSYFSSLMYSTRQLKTGSLKEKRLYNEAKTDATNKRFYRRPRGEAFL